jgi:exosortase E/protease (VPEID-CTERM system)
VGWLVALVATVGSWLLLLGSWAALRQLPLRLGGTMAASLVVGTAAYVVGRFSQQLWNPLRRWTFALAAPLSKLLVPAIEVDPQSFTIGTGDFSVEIAPDCSGYEGLGLTLAFLTLFFWVFRARLRFPRVLLLTVPILVTVWLLNIVRIAVLVVLGIRVSAQVALGSFHSYMGSLLVVSVNLAIMFTILRTRSLLRDEGKPALLGENIAASFLLPFLSLVAAALVTATLSNAGSTTWYPVRIVVASCVLYRYRHRVGTFLRRDPGSGVAPLRWIILVTILGTAAWLACIAPDRSWSAPSNFLPDHSFGSGAKVAWWVIRSVGAVLVIPMVEELAFRGFVIRRLVSNRVESVKWADITPFALVAQALLFGVLHSRHLLGGSLAGLAFGWLGRRTRCGYAPVLAHALTNATLLALAAFTNRWDWL